MADTPRRNVADRERAAVPELIELGAVYFVLALLSIGLALQPHMVADVWFPNAVAIGVLATTPRSRWFALLTMVAAANFAANLMLRADALHSAIVVPSNLVEIFGGALLLQRFRLERRFADDATTFVAALALGGFVPQVLGSTLGAGALQLIGVASFASVWPVWYIDSTLGTMALLPLTLAVRQVPWSTSWFRLTRPLPVFLAVAVVATVGVAFHGLPQPYSFVALPLVIAVFFVEPVVIFALVALLMLTVLVGFDLEWFKRPPYSPPWSSLYFYLPAAVTVLPTLLLTVVVQRMRRLQANTTALTMIGGDATAVFDDRGVLRGVNKAFSRYFTGSRESVIGRGIEQAVDARLAAETRERFERVMATGEALRATNEFDTGLGRRVLEVEYLPMEADGGRPTGVMFSSHDITDLVGVQRELESNVSQLRTANDGMQQFVRIASHDMREPLNTIIQFCGLIPEEPETALSPAARQYFAHVARGAKRMRTMLDDLLEFVRMDQAARMPLGAVALNSVFGSVKDALTSQISERHAQIEVAPLHGVIGHENLLVLLFQNLVSNGIKFTPIDRRPHVKIDSRDEGEFVVVTVIDEGIGISAADQASLFVPFRRLHARRQYDGTGLGLAICRRIVDAMKGEISLSSELGAGTCVQVRLRSTNGAPSANSV